MEKRIEVLPSEVVSRIAEWYRPDDVQLVTIVGLDTGTKIEVQWVFAAYQRLNDLTMFRALFDYGDTIPSVVSLIPSAWLVEREIVDCFGVAIPGAKPGVMLDVDSVQAPLRKTR